MKLADLRGKTLRHDLAPGVLERGRETLDSAPSALLQQLRAACRRFQSDGARILGQEGNVRARMGDVDDARDALPRAA